MNGEELAAIEARAKAASAGPWRTFTSGVANGDHWYVWDNSTGSIAQISSNDGTNEESRQPDAEFIAHSREDIPALLAAVRERDNTIARVRAILDSREYANFIPRLRAALDPQENTMSANDIRCGEPFHFFLRVTTICNRPKGHTGEHHPCMLAMDKPASGAMS